MKPLKTLLATALLSGSLTACAVQSDHTAQPTTQTAPMLRIFELGVRKDKIAEFDAAGKANLSASVANEKGTLAMHAVRLQDKPDMAYLFEIYQDEAAYQAHVNGAPYQGYLKAAPQLLTDHKKFTATDVQFLAEKPAPIAVQNNERFPRINFVEVQVKPKHHAAFHRIVTDEMAQAMKTENGVLAMYAATAKDDPNHWFFIEIYANDQAYTDHHATPHFQHYLKETDTMLTDKKSHDIGWKLLMSKGGLRFEK